MTRLRLDPVPWTIALVAILSFWKLWFIRDVIWDDNCWLLSVYATNSLHEYLGTGYYELRRVALGTFSYFFLKLHKDTDYFFLVWHAAETVLAVGTPLLLYALIQLLFPKKTVLAFFIAISFTVFHLDHTLPYAVAVSYRICLLLIIASLYLSSKSIDGGNIRYAPMAAALLLAAIAYYVFIEGAVAFEVTRLAILAYLLNRQTRLPVATYVKRLAAYTAPFFILCVPLIIYKLVYKPYGIYQGIYHTDIMFLFDVTKNIKELTELLVTDWLRFWKFGKYGDATSSFVGLLSVVLFFLVLRLLPTTNARPDGLAHQDTGKNSTDKKTYLDAIFIGMAFLLPPAILFKFAGLELTLMGAQNNTHAIPLQPGYAIFVGLIFTYIYTHFSCRKLGKQRTSFYLACILGLGIYYNNIAVDIFVDSWTNQSRFWQAFVKRFPVLPEKADFMFEVHDRSYYPDTRINYDFELILNLLYATSNEASKFRRYRAYTAEEFYRGLLVERRGVIDSSPVTRGTHFGNETLDPKDLIVVLYNGSELLINREIRQRYPKIPYNAWLDKDDPTLPEPKTYALRHKVNFSR